MKARLPKVYSLLICLALFAVLSGCELARPEGQEDAGPVSAMPPTLAPLGAETNVVSEATAIPTIINVQATAAPVIQNQDQVIEDPADEPRTYRQATDPRPPKESREEVGHTY